MPNLDTPDPDTCTQEEWDAYRLGTAAERAAVRESARLANSGAAVRSSGDDDDPSNCDPNDL